MTPLPPTSFCATGYAAKSLYEHERVLIKLHHAGKLRLIDGGWDSENEGGVRRWRVSWGAGSAAVRAMLGVTLLDESRAAFWVYAEANRPWSIRDQENPVQRMGMRDQGLVDPSAGFSLGESNPLLEMEDVEFFGAVFNGGMRDSPVLVYNDADPERFGQEMRRFRRATRGMCGLLPIDDSTRERVNALLPVRRRIPRRAVRLYLPPWWVGHEEDMTVPLDRLARTAEWRKIVDTVLRVSSWRPEGEIRIIGDMWPALLIQPMQGDARIVENTKGGEIRWLPAPDDTGKQVLRRRLGETTEQERKIKEATEAASALVTERSAALEVLSARLRRARRSRRALAELAQRLRRERDNAEGALSGSISGAWRDAWEAELEAALYAAELDGVDDRRGRLIASLGQEAIRTKPDVDPDAEVVRLQRWEFGTFAELLHTAQRELEGLRFGPRTAVSSELDDHRRSPQWLRRTWNILELLSRYAMDRREAGEATAVELRGFAHYVRVHGGDRGVSVSLVASGESEVVANTPRFRNARTFPVPTEVNSLGREFFGAHVKIDRGGGIAPRLHFLDDTLGSSGMVYIGYLGPHLPSPETN